jgi:hypothetical protein
MFRRLLSAFGPKPELTTDPYYVRVAVPMTNAERAAAKAAFNEAKTKMVRLLWEAEFPKGEIVASIGCYMDGREHSLTYAVERFERLWTCRELHVGYSHKMTALLEVWAKCEPFQAIRAAMFWGVYSDPILRRRGYYPGPVDYPRCVYSANRGRSLKKYGITEEELHEWQKESETLGLASSKSELLS